MCGFVWFLLFFVLDTPLCSRASAGIVQTNLSTGVSTVPFVTRQINRRRRRVTKAFHQYLMSHQEEPDTVSLVTRTLIIFLTNVVKLIIKCAWLPLHTGADVR